MTKVFTLVYTEKIKPYVRMTKRSKWVNPQAQEYLASKDSLALAAQMKLIQHYDHSPAQGSYFGNRVQYSISVQVGAPNILQWDLDNVIKAVQDALQGIVFQDDRYCMVIRDSYKYRFDDYYTVIRARPYVGKELERK